MTKTKYFVLTATSALVFTACDGNAPENKANAANTSEKAPLAALTKDALIALERSSYEAWKSKDAKFWGTFLSDKFVGYGSSGKLDKASATKEYTSADCEIKSFALSEEQMKPLGNDAALITHKTTVDGTCGGQKVPANSRAASVYVRDGDKSRGEWGRIFIQTQDDAHATHVVTARSGRIDSSPEKSELVLQDAVETRLPAADARDQSYVVERIAQLRIQLRTGRRDLLALMRKPESNPDDMEWGELRRFVAKSTGPDRREGLLILHKRLAFSLSPLLFALFGSALALRLRRGSRGFGVLVSLLVLLIYYLLTIAGDQMARGGSLNPIVGAWLATALTSAFAVALLVSRQRQISSWLKHRAADRSATAAGEVKQTSDASQIRTRHWAASFPTLLDLGIVRTMTASFLFGFVALVLIFNVFTTFELWRFLASHRDRLRLLAQYLFYLLPLVSVELFPGSVLVATLLTYALIARRREAVAWWASGQSVYRLMLPGLVFAILIAAGSWLIQERVMPQANVRQDNLRAKIKGGNITQPAGGSERRWLVSANGSRIYSYEFDTQRQALLRPTIFEFDPAGVEVKRIVSGEEGKWPKPNDLEIEKPQWINLEEARVSRQSAAQLTLSGVDPPSVFRPVLDRPSQLSAARLRDYIKPLKERGAETATLAVALQRKYAGPFSVIVMALIGMPLAISFGRKSTVIALCSAVVVSLAFWLLAGGFQQLGEHALLPPAAAAWAPIAIFAGGGLYFISRVRT